MKNLDLKSVLFIEFAIIILTALFGLDFLPRSSSEFQRICMERWSKDPKQYEICMEPHSEQVNLDKYAIGAGVIAGVVFPVAYFLTRKKS